jgi:hypothetical protein
MMVAFVDIRLARVAVDTVHGLGHSAVGTMCFVASMALGQIELVEAFS